MHSDLTKPQSGENTAPQTLRLPAEVAMKAYLKVEGQQVPILDYNVPVDN